MVKEIYIKPNLEIQVVDDCIRTSGEEWELPEIEIPHATTADDYSW